MRKLPPWVLGLSGDVPVICRRKDILHKVFKRSRRAVLRRTRLLRSENSQEKVFEIMAPVGTVAFAKQDLKEWMKPVDVVVPKALRESGHTAKVYREPYGVTLVIGPFNGPLTLLFDPAVQVIAAGNPCILKLSEGLPATSKVLLDLIPKYFDPRAVTAVTGSKDEVTELLKLPFDFIFFTGSVKVGKIVMEAAAKNLTPVLLELGGQNPAFVDATANIPDAAKKIVWGATAWGGQWCTSPGYAYVHESIAEQFVEECKKAVVELYGTDPKSRPSMSARTKVSRCCTARLISRSGCRGSAKKRKLERIRDDDIAQRGKE